MSFELSSTITSLQKEGISVADSGKTNAQRVDAELQKRFGAEPAPDFVGMQLALVQLVEDDLGLLLATDNTHVHGVVGSRLQLRQRNAGFDEVFDSLSGIRGAVAAVHGETARIELFGDVSALPQVPLELHRLGIRVHDQLIDDSFVLPEVRLAGFTPLDQQAVAAGLKPPLDRFGQTLASLSLERKDADATLFDKNVGVEEFRRTVRYAAGCLASLYGLAGFDDLAARIRPKRRSSRLGGGGDTDGGGESGGAAGESGGTSTEGSNSASGASGAPSAEATGPIGIVS